MNIASPLTTNEPSGHNTTSEYICVTQDQFTQKLEKLIDEKAMLKHSFYQQLWNCGFLYPQALQNYIIQTSCLETIVIEALEGLLVTAHESSLIHSLASSDISEEMHHPVVYNKHAAVFGVSTALVEPNGIMKKILDTVHSFFQDKSPFRILGFLFALETQICKNSRNKKETLWQNYHMHALGSKTDAEAYYELHSSADAIHSAHWKEALQTECLRTEDQAAALEGVRLACRFLLLFLDSVEGFFWKNLPQEINMPKAA